MPASAYLNPDEYADWGVPDATATLVQQASAMVNAFLRRPEGLVWVADAAGAPTYMAGLDPAMTWVTSAAIAPGASVVVPLPGAWLDDDLIGEVVIVDRDTPAVEACVIQAVQPGAGVVPPSIILTSVTHAHDIGVTLETGLVVTEERSMPSKRSVARLSRYPVVRLLSGLGRYGYGRRSDQMAGMYAEYNLLAALQAFGGPPAWTPFDIRQASVSQTSSEVWVPAGMLLAYYSDVRLHYLTGWSATSLPPAVKSATATLADALSKSAALVGSIKRIQAGDTSMEKFADTLLTADLVRTLSAYQIRAWI